MAIIFVTHDLGVVASVCDQVSVMYAGQVVEQAPVDEFFAAPRHPYSIGLLDSMPQSVAKGDRLRMIAGHGSDPEPVPVRLPVRAPLPARDRGLHDGTAAARTARRRARRALHPPRRRCDGGRAVTGEESTSASDRGGRAVGNVGRRAAAPRTRPREGLPGQEGTDAQDGGARARRRRRELRHRSGEILGLVGESGSGKSTTGRLVLRLIEPTAGSIELEGRDVLALKGDELRKARRDMQMVFQDPYSSLDPLAPVADIVGEPFQVHFKLSRKEREEKVVALLEQVGMSSAHLRRFPSEFSGGQRQRIAVARALALEPKLIIADEPVERARHVDAVAGGQPAGRSPGAARRRLPPHRARSVDRASRERSDRGHVPRHHRRGRGGRVGVLRPCHPYSEALISAIPVPNPQDRAQPQPRRARGRSTESARPAVGVSLPPTVCVRDGHLQRRSIPNRPRPRMAAPSRAISTPRARRSTAVPSPSSVTRQSRQTADASSGDSGRSCRPSSEIAFPRTSLCTTSGSRPVMISAATARLSGHVESECG